MKLLKRGCRSMLLSSAISLVVLLLIEVVTGWFGTAVSPMTPEYVAMFPTETIALEVDILLYGVIGLAFSTMSCIFEIDRLGFVIQNILYCIATAVFWIPIVTLLWQLQRYPQALGYTVLGFFASYAIMSIVAYRTTRRDVDAVNAALQKHAEEQDS